MREAMYSHDLYAHALRLWEARERGSFVAARALADRCRQAWIVVQASSDKVLTPVQQQAVQDVRTRCAPLWQNHEVLTAAPRPDDAWGRAYAQAEEKALNGDRAALLGELGRQGAVGLILEGSAMWASGEVVVFRGQPWGGLPDAEAWSAALDVAHALQTSGGGSLQGHLELLPRCVQHGACTGTREDLLSGYRPFDAATRSAIFQLAESLQVALRQNDVAQFAAKP